MFGLMVIGTGKTDIMCIGMGIGPRPGEMRIGKPEFGYSMDPDGAGKEASGVINMSLGF